MDTPGTTNYWRQQDLTQTTKSHMKVCFVVFIFYLFLCFLKLPVNTQETSHYGESKYLLSFSLQNKNIF
jgi:hypothetical protein